MASLKRKPHFVSCARERLHVLEIRDDDNLRKHDVLFLHGAVENGKIFYSESKDKGLAPFLARSGFRCLVADFRGRGRSSPSIGKETSHGQHELITEDIPEIINKLCSSSKYSVVCHSWAGVLFYSALSRGLLDVTKISSVVCFGTKRSVNVWNMEKIVKVDIFWLSLAGAIARMCGYLPAKSLGVGSDNDSKRFVEECQDWVRRDSSWVDQRDGFDYETHIRKLEQVPPVLTIAADGDLALGHPSDVKKFFFEEMKGGQRCTYKMVEGFDHVNMLTSERAEKTHFLEVLEFILKNAKSNKS